MLRFICQLLKRAGAQTIIDFFGPQSMKSVSKLNIGLSLFASFLLQAQQFNQILPDHQKFHWSELSSYWPFIKQFFSDDGVFERINTIVAGAAGNLAGNALGALIGGLVFGPVGAYIGAVIGAAIGTTIGRRCGRPIAESIKTVGNGISYAAKKVGTGISCAAKTVGNGISCAGKKVYSWFSSWFN